MLSSRWVLRFPSNIHLFALLVRHSEWILNHLVRNDFLVELDNRVIKTSPYESHTGNPALRSTSLLNRILVGRRDDDHKQPRFQQAWFLGLIAGSDEVTALHPDGVQRHLGEWCASPLDDPESKLREFKSALALMTEVDWRTPGCKTCQDVRYHKGWHSLFWIWCEKLNLEAIRRADAEAEKALKRVKVLEEQRAAKRASATPMDELEEFATNAEVSAESMMIANEAVLTETREAIEAFTVSALQQAHEMSHRPETTAEFFSKPTRT